ncbi:MAG: 3'-5' exonuclease [Thermoplasmatota archaeon]
MASLNEDLLVRHSFTQLINPGIPIPHSATALHGIGDLHVRDQPTFRELAGRVQSFLHDAALIAYNGRRF